MEYKARIWPKSVADLLSAAATGHHESDLANAPMVSDRRHDDHLKLG